MQSLTTLQVYIDQLDRAGILARLADIALDWPVVASQQDTIIRQQEALALRLKLTTEGDAWLENARAWLHKRVAINQDLASAWLES